MTRIITVLFITLISFCINAVPNDYQLKRASSVVGQYSNLQEMESHYKRLLINSLKTAMPDSAKKIDPKALDVLATCHLASISAWPVDVRMDMLNTYSQYTDTMNAMKAFESRLDLYVSKKMMKYKDMEKYVYLQSIIYDGCADKISTPHWKKKLKRAGIIDYY